MHSNQEYAGSSKSNLLICLPGSSDLDEPERKLDPVSKGFAQISRKLLLGQNTAAQDKVPDQPGLDLQSSLRQMYLVLE